MKIGLCLSGGGSRGAYQIGACMALKEAGIYNKIDCFSGTSIGSVNAALLASTSISEVKDMWFDIDGDSLKYTENFFNRLRSEKVNLIYNGVYTIKVLREKLKKHLNINVLRQKEVYITISSAGDKQGKFKALFKSSYRHYIKKDKHAIYAPLWKEKEENIYKQILASCSIPIAFSPVIIDGKAYYDGGLFDNVPVKPLIDAGCDKVIVIHLDKLPYFYKHKYPNIKFYSLKPKHSLGWLLNFSSEKSKLRYHQGYTEMNDFLKENKIL